MRPLSPDDVVPRLRGDVLIADAPAGMGGELVDIKPNGGDVMHLHAFELSLARMLDGRRRAQEVVDRAVQLGLPLGLPSLDGFIRELEDRSLVARGPGGASPWQVRATWSAAERALFQAALKSARQGQVIEARRALDQLLLTSPRNADARMLRASLDEQSTRAFRDAFLASERAWLQDSAPTRAELKAVRPSFGPLAVLLALAGSLLVGFFVPFPRVVNAPAVLKPAAVIDVEAPRNAEVRSVAVAEHQRVEGGDVLYTDTRGEVHAPFAGTVTDVRVSKGQPTQLGQTAVTIEDQSRLNMVVRLTGSGASAVRAGQTATLTLGDKSVKATLDSVHGSEAHAFIDNRNGEVEPGNATADIEVAPASLYQRLR